MKRKKPKLKTEDRLGAVEGGALPVLSAIYRPRQLKYPRSPPLSGAALNSIIIQRATVLKYRARKTKNWLYKCKHCAKYCL